MANYCNFKSPIILKESIVNDPITVKVSAIPKGDGTDNKKQATLDVLLLTKNMVLSTQC